MEIVEVVIKIPKEYKDYIKGGAGIIPDKIIQYLFNALDNGTVLPKGHGRLGDIDFEIAHYESMITNPTPDVTRYDRKTAPVILKALRMIGPVIEADRGDDNG